MHLIVKSLLVTFHDDVTTERIKNSTVNVTGFCDVTLRNLVDIC